MLQWTLLSASFPAIFSVLFSYIYKLKETGSGSERFRVRVQSRSLQLFSKILIG